MKSMKKIPTLPPPRVEESPDIGGEFAELEQQLRAVFADGDRPVLAEDRKETIRAAYRRRFIRKPNRVFRRVAEWLIVVAIIGILAGMMLPALNQARPKAREISRISELRQKQLEADMEAVAYGASQANAIEEIQPIQVSTDEPVQYIVEESKVKSNVQAPSKRKASSPMSLKPTAMPPKVVAKDGMASEKISSRKEEWAAGATALPAMFSAEKQDRGEVAGGLAMKSSRVDGFSTFAIDTDNASYIRARDAIRNRIRPESGAIRAEEFINYYDYHYPRPEGETLFSLTSEVMRNPFRPDSCNLAIGVQGKFLGIAPGVRSRYHVVVDASGSMALGNRWLPALETLEQLKTKLQPRDQIKVVYSHDGDKMPNGRGDLGGNILQMGQSLLAAPIDGQNHLIVITDGDDVPEADGRESLLALAKQLRDHRMGLTVFGFGALRDAAFWEKLAEIGGGSLVYADQPGEVARLLDEEFEARFRPIAEDVKIQVEFNPAATLSFRLIGYDERVMATEDFRNDARRASPVGSGQAVTAVYEWIPAPGIRPESVIATVRLRYRNLDGGGFDEKEFLITAEQSGRNFEDAPQSAQLAVLAGEFAESLKYPEAGGVAQASGILARLPALSGKNLELRELLLLMK